MPLMSDVRHRIAPTSASPMVKKSKPGCVIRTFIFDLFGVVLDFDEGSVYQRIASHCREPSTALREIDGLVSLPALITGKVSLVQLYERMC